MASLHSPAACSATQAQSPTCCSSSDSSGNSPAAGAECRCASRCNAAGAPLASRSCCWKESAGVLTAPHAVNATPLTLAHNTCQESHACVCNSAACDRDRAGDEAGRNAGPGQQPAWGGSVFPHARPFCCCSWPRPCCHKDRAGAETAG